MFIFLNFFNSLALSFYTLTIAYCEYANAYTIEIILHCTSKLYKASLVCSLYILRLQSTCHVPISTDHSSIERSTAYAKFFNE